jgi:hypothetical protein
VAAFNIIPTATSPPASPKTFSNRKVIRLSGRQLPILVGTEMNSFGQKFVDLFQPKNQALPEFARGAASFTHTVSAEGQDGIHRLAMILWATPGLKNDFYAMSPPPRTKNSETLKL